MCWDLGDQYMYGPDLLVAPVLEPHATARSVYLPDGALWTNLTTGEVHDGGRWLDVEAPLATIPVFARDDRHHGLLGLVGARRTSKEG